MSSRPARPRRPGSRKAATSAGRSTRPTRSTSDATGSALPAAKPGSPGGGRGGKGKGKFNAAGEHIDGHWFASAAEGERYRQLKDMLEAGRIGALRLQPSYPLHVNGRLITTYRADFAYDVIDERGGCIRSVVEDIKGMITDVFVIKRKLFDALQPVPLSVIELKGSARHPTNPALSEKTGKPVACRRGWVDLHWKNRIPD